MSGKTPTGAGQPLLYNGATSPPPYGGATHHHHHFYDQPHHGHQQGHPHGVAYVPHVHPVPVVVQPAVSSTVVVVRERPRCRFLRAFIIAIAIWFLLGALVKSIIIVTHGFRHGRPHQWTVGPGNQSPDYSIPAGVDLTACEEPLKNGDARTTFEIASSSDAVLLMTGGVRLHGTVRVTTTSAKTDSVKFSVGLSSLLGREADTIVCSLKRKDGENGIGIFNPRRPWTRPNDSVKYDIIVEFPEGHPIVKRFESDVMNSIYTIDDIKSKILFNQLSLHGSNGHIYSKSVVAQWADIQTSNGRIEGYYNGSDYLNIHTSNGRIDVDVDFNQVASSKGILSLTTSNGALNARLHLHDLTSRKGAVSEFDVTTKTSNSRLDVSFRDAPVDSRLNHRAATSNSPAEVTLHPTFEGHFSLDSSLFTPVVHEHRVEDPSGKDRKRIIRYRNVRGFVDGDVSWGGNGEGKGKVAVKTSNARVTLNL